MVLDPIPQILAVFWVSTPAPHLSRAPLKISRDPYGILLKPTFFSIFSEYIGFKRPNLNSVECSRMDAAESEFRKNSWIDAAQSES